MLVGIERMRSPMRARLLLGIVATLGGCSSTSSTPTPTTVRASCPATFAGAANGAACAVEGQSCDFLFPCTTFAAPERCTCTSGAFVCGSVLPADASDPMPCAPPVGTAACPPTEAMAAIASCENIGQQCAYPSACQSVPTYDVCECVSAQSVAGNPRFTCTASCEVPDGAIPPSGDGAAPDGATIVEAGPTDATTIEDAKAPDAVAADGAGTDSAPDAPADH